MPVDPILRRQIIRLAETSLVAADVVDILPTPLDQVAAAAGIGEVVNISDIPDDLVVRKPRALGRILGAYLYRSNTAFVDLSQPTGRKRFILAHETGHKIVPWHDASYHLDDEIRLFRDSEQELEEEANLAATLLMFQGGRYHGRALDYETCLETPISLAEVYGASFHASIWFYTEHHPEPVALLIAGHLARRDGTVPIWRSVESRSFSERFGPVRTLVPDAGLQLRSDGSDPMADVARNAIRASLVETGTVNLVDRRGEQVRCVVDAFFNQRCLFVMLYPRRVVRRGRRVQVQAS